MQIDRVTLATRNLEGQRHFYGEVLGLPTSVDAEGALHVHAGRSELIFQLDESVTPFYHVAFGVATSSVEDAVDWVRSRVPLIADPEDGQELFLSKLWGANQFYFADADGNVLEFITRHIEPGDTQICYIAEVGTPVADLPATVARFEQELGGARKNGESLTFNPVGDSDGLLIVVPAGRNWFPTKQAANPLPLKVELRAPIPAPVELVHADYVIHARPL
jgi:catechol 2,3-dioxygenase-like lactoylglutathione lyase family enzyme